MVSIYLYQADSDTFSVRSLANLTQSGDIMKKYIAELESNPLADPFYKFESYQILAKSGFAPEASDKIRILLNTDPKNLNYLEWLALYEQGLGNYNSAITHRKQIGQFDPWNAQNYLNLGVLYKQIGDSENKVKMLNKVLSFAENTEISKLARTELA
jgi:tetratricopeptide (TPR) repeat protein